MSDDRLQEIKARFDDNPGRLTLDDLRWLIREAAYLDDAHEIADALAAEVERITVERDELRARWEACQQLLKNAKERECSLREQVEGGEAITDMAVRSEQRRKDEVGELRELLVAAVARTQTLEAALRDLADHAEQFGADELFLPVKNAWAALAAESEKP